MHQTTSDNQQLKDNVKELKENMSFSSFTLLKHPLKGGLYIV